MNLRDETIEISKNGVEKIEIQCCCRPIEQKDIEYISQFINLDAPEGSGGQSQLLQDSKGQESNLNIFRSIKSEVKEDDPLQLARETKEIEQRIVAKDSEIKQLEDQIAEAERENERLLAEKAE